MPQIVPIASWRRRAALSHARSLLGKYLLRTGHAPRMITEVEAYNGEKDLASHARVGRTGRTEVMYGPGGVWYVYLCYGVHEMLNLVVGPPDWPAAVLIRGLEGCSGPGRLTRLLDIDRRLNGAAVSRASGLWIEDHGIHVPRSMIRSGPRVGVDYAGPIWANKPWRFSFDPAALRRRPAELRPGKLTRGRRRVAGRASSESAEPR